MDTWSVFQTTAKYVPFPAVIVQCIQQNKFSVFFNKVGGAPLGVLVQRLGLAWGCQVKNNDATIQRRLKQDVLQTTEEHLLIPKVISKCWVIFFFLVNCFQKQEIPKRQDRNIQKMEFQTFKHPNLKKGGLQLLNHKMGKKWYKLGVPQLLFSGQSLITNL